MSTPIAEVQDLATFLGTDVDPTRATLILSLAQGLCETIVSPVPASALGVVLDVAGRAYNNVNSATQIGMGSATASFANTGAGGVGGLYLSRANKTALRAYAGRGGAFSIDLLPRGVCEIQSVEVVGTAGTFTLTFCEQTTTTLAYNATVAQVQAALESLSAIGAGNVAVDASFTVAFRNALGYQAVPQIRANDAALTGVVTVSTVVQGAPPAWGA